MAAASLSCHIHIRDPDYTFVFQDDHPFRAAVRGFLPFKRQCFPFSSRVVHCEVAHIGPWSCDPTLPQSIQKAVLCALDKFTHEFSFCFDPKTSALSINKSTQINLATRSITVDGKSDSSLDVWFVALHNIASTTPRWPLTSFFDAASILGFTNAAEQARIVAAAQGRTDPSFLRIVTSCCNTALVHIESIWSGTKPATDSGRFTFWRPSSFTESSPERGMLAHIDSAHRLHLYLTWNRRTLGDNLVGRGSFARVTEVTPLNGRLDRQLCSHSSPLSYARVTLEALQALGDAEGIVSCEGYAEYQGKRKRRHPEIAVPKARMLMPQLAPLHPLFLKVLRGEMVIDARRALELTRDLLAAVRTMHDRGVYHRDLKAGNFLTDAENHLKVCDFSASRLLGTVGRVGRGTTNIIVSPEEAKHLVAEYAKQFAKGGPVNVYYAPGLATVTAKADLWAVGCFLLALLTGKMFYSSLIDKINSPEEYSNLHKIATLSEETIFESVSSAPAAHLLKRLLHPDPEKRCDAHEAYGIILDLLGESEPVATEDAEAAAAGSAEPVATEDAEAAAAGSAEPPAACSGAGSGSEPSSTVRRSAGSDSSGEARPRPHKLYSHFMKGPT